VRRRERPAQTHIGEPPATFRIGDWADPQDPLSSTDEPFIRAVRRWLDARLAWNYSQHRRPNT
jgi:hypothetical protein